MGKLLLAVSAVALLLAVQVSSTSYEYWHYYCAGGNYTLAYNSSLDVLAAVLPGRVSSSPVLFNSTQLAAAGGEGTTVYAVAQCQLNTSRSACERCVTRGLQDARALCPFGVGAFVFRDLCTVGYYKDSLDLFPEKSELHQTATTSEGSGVTVHGEYGAAVGELAWAVANKTASAGYFATGEKMVRTRDYELTLYGLAMCSPSLTSAECKMCLVQLLEMLFIADDKAHTGARAATLWCSYLYSTHRMFSGMPTVKLPADDAFGEDDTHTKKLYILKWVLGAVGTALAVTIFIATILYCWKKVVPGQKGQEVELMGTENEDEEARRDDSSGQMNPPPFYVIDLDGTIRTDGRDWRGFPRILWGSLQAAGYTTPPLYEVVEYLDHDIPRRRATTTVLPHLVHQQWPDLSMEYQGHDTFEAIESVALQMLNAFCVHHPQLVRDTPLGLLPIVDPDDPAQERLPRVSEVLEARPPLKIVQELFQMLEATYQLQSLRLSVQFVMGTRLVEGIDNRQAMDQQIVTLQDQRAQLEFERGLLIQMVVNLQNDMYYVQNDRAILQAQLAQSEAQRVFLVQHVGMMQQQVIDAEVDAAEWQAIAQQQQQQQAPPVVVEAPPDELQGHDQEGSEGPPPPASPVSSAGSAAD